MLKSKALKIACLIREELQNRSGMWEVEDETTEEEIMNAIADIIVKFAD